jgi:kynurenine formamidase
VPIKRLDLSQQLKEGMPIFAGMAAPYFPAVAVVEQHEFGMEEIHMRTHVGTHVDFPGHIKPGRKRRQEYGPEHLWVDDAQVLHMHGKQGPVTLEEIGPLLARLRPGGVALIATGHSRYWGTPAYYRNNPYLEREAALAVLERGIGAIGFDGPSADSVAEGEPTGADDFPLHQVWLGAGCLLIENLTRLEELPEQVELVIGAINIWNATGIPSAVWAKFMS